MNIDNLINLKTKCAAAHPGVSEHTEALIVMLSVLWDYGIPSISFTLLHGHGSLQVMMGEWRHPDAKAAS